jgi:CheY-like chemotaxis protein
VTTLNRKRILVVDDIPHWRKLLSSLLSDYEVEALATCDEAVKAIDQHGFDVAVLDLRLKDEDIWNVDGIALLKKIKREQPNTGVIILTGYRESARDQILREYKPNEIIHKETFDNTSFRETVRMLANKSSIR